MCIRSCLGAANQRRLSERLETKQMFAYHLADVGRRVHVTEENSSR